MNTELDKLFAENTALRDENADLLLSAHAARWQAAETAPKTRVILADTGYPWPLPCMWDAEAGKWAIAFLNVETQNAAKESQNVWWQTEYECAILRWAEMPALPNAG